MILLASSSWSSHGVGERELEEHPIWKKCCADQDCVPQQVKIVGREEAGKISVKIEGVQAMVNKGKLHPVPSRRTGFVVSTETGRLQMKTFTVSSFQKRPARFELVGFLSSHD